MGGGGGAVRRSDLGWVEHHAHGSTDGLGLHKKSGKKKKKKMFQARSANKECSHNMCVPQVFLAIKYEIA